MIYINFKKAGILWVPAYNITNRTLSITPYRVFSDSFSEGLPYQIQTQPNGSGI